MNFFIYFVLVEVHAVCRERLGEGGEPLVTTPACHHLVYAMIKTQMSKQKLLDPLWLLTFGHHCTKHPGL